MRNQLLRAARERTPSRQVPGEWLSRREVAEAVNTWIYENTKKTTTLDANYLAKLERGVVRWPSARYRAGLRAVLSVATDAELGFYPLGGQRPRPALTCRCRSRRTQSRWIPWSRGSWLMP